MSGMILNNREISVLIWVSMLGAWLLTKPSIRFSVHELLRAFLHWKILVCLGAMLIYTSAVVAILYMIGFWRIVLLKDTLVWFCFSGFVTLVHYVTTNESSRVVRKIILDNIKLVIILEFLIGVYVMSLPAELVFVPIATFLVMLNEVAKTDREYRYVQLCTEIMLAVIGFCILGYVIVSVVQDYQSFGSLDTARAFVCLPLLSILFAPFIYMVLVFAAYESLLVQLSVGPEKEVGTIRYAKRRVILYCKFSLRRLHRLRDRPPYEFFQIESREDVDRVLTALHAE